MLLNMIFCTAAEINLVEVSLLPFSRALIGVQYPLALDSLLIIVVYYTISFSPLGNLPDRNLAGA